MKIKIHGKLAYGVFEIDSFSLMYDLDKSTIGTICIKQGGNMAVLRGQLAGPGGAFTESPEEIFVTELVKGDIVNEKGIGLGWFTLPTTPCSMGQKGGAVSSARKKKSSRENGKKGGRPKKLKV